MYITLFTQNLPKYSNKYFYLGLMEDNSQLLARWQRSYCCTAAAAGQLTDTILKELRTWFIIIIVGIIIIIRFNLDQGPHDKNIDENVKRRERKE